MANQREMQYPGDATKPSTPQSLNNPQAAPNKFERAIGENEPAGANSSPGTTAPKPPRTLAQEERDEKELHVPPTGGAAGDGERYRTEDGHLHDESQEFRDHEPRFAEPTYRPEVEKQFETDRGQEHKSTVERDGETLDSGFRDGKADDGPK